MNAGSSLEGMGTHAFLIPTLGARFSRSIRAPESVYVPLPRTGKQEPLIGWRVGPASDSRKSSPTGIVRVASTLWCCLCG